MTTKAKTEATARALLALVDDLTNLHEAAHRVRVQIFALAEHHGIAVPALRPIGDPSE
jgi:hypothetical protein